MFPLLILLKNLLAYVWRMGGEVVVLLVNTTALVMAINSMVHVVPIVITR